MRKLVSARYRNAMMKLAATERLRGLHQSAERLADATRNHRSQKCGEPENDRCRQWNDEKHSLLRSPNSGDDMRSLVADFAIECVDQRCAQRFQWSDLVGQP